MQFSPQLRPGVAAGAVTLTVRLWARPEVKVGGRYRSAGVTIVIDDVELVPFSAITDDDLTRTGEASREALRARTSHAGPVHDDTLVCRTEFHVEPEEA